jgi:hypothetical protein
MGSANTVIMTDYAQPVKFAFAFPIEMEYNIESRIVVMD